MGGRMTIDWSGAHRGLCAICLEPIPSAGAFVCRSCGRVCDVELRPSTPYRGTVFITDARSKCCGADIENAKRVTCSDRCHERFVEELEREFGAVKIVVDEATGKRHLVPTRTIIERGVRQDELHNFPEAPP